MERQMVSSGRSLLSRPKGSSSSSPRASSRSEEHTSELQSRLHIVCRLLLEKKKSHAHRDLNVPPIVRPLTNSESDSADSHACFIADAPIHIGAIIILRVNYSSPLLPATRTI